MAGVNSLAQPTAKIHVTQDAKTHVKITVHLITEVVLLFAKTIVSNSVLQTVKPHVKEVALPHAQEDVIIPVQVDVQSHVLVVVVNHAKVHADMNVQRIVNIVVMVQLRWQWIIQNHC